MKDRNTQYLWKFQLNIIAASNFLSYPRQLKYAVEPEGSFDLTED